MKKQLLFLFTIIFLLAACNNAAKKEDSTTTEKTESDKASDASDKSSSSGISALDDGTKRMEELKKLSPISNETLKSFLPSEVMGMKRTSFNVSSAMGYAVGTAEYKKDDTTNYTVAIYDCAGEAGSGFYAMSYLSRMNMEREDDNGYEKTVSYKGTNALEAYDKHNHEHRLHFLASERFWVSVEGNEGLDRLKGFADALGLEKLKGVK